LPYRKGSHSRGKRIDDAQALDCHAVLGRKKSFTARRVRQAGLKSEGV